MILKNTIALGIACLLAGVLVGYLFWGWGLSSGKLSGELATVKARQTQIESDLKTAQSRLETMTKELESERARRVKLELLISEGRK